MKNLQFLLLLGVILVMANCRKPEEKGTQQPPSLPEVNIPAGFDWKMAHPVNFHITGTQNQVITITSADGAIIMHKSKILAGVNMREIKLTIPDFIKEVKVNGIPVLITGPDVNVTIQPLKEILLANYNLSFDDLNDYVDLGDITQLNSATAFTIEGWAKQTVNTQNDYIFSKHFSSNNRISIAPYGGSLYLIVSNGGNTYGLWSNYSTDISGGTWFHFAMVYDGTGITDADRLKLYINGVEKVLAYTGTIPASTPSNISGMDACLGSNNMAGDFYGGFLDEVRIWSVARSGAEILANYDNLVSPTATNLEAYWRMDEGSGTTTFDATVGNYDGTIYGCTWNAESTGFDSDGDGVADEDDDYPLDDTRAFDNYYPVAGTGTLAFEDLWPWWGDYDFNDLILDYRFKTVTNYDNEVVEVIGTFTVRANGAKMHNGFGFALPDADATIASNIVVTGYSLTQGIITIDGTSHFESGHTYPVVIAFDDTWDLMEGIYNTVPGGAYTPPVSIDITMTVTGGGPFEESDFALDTWNPFLFIDLTRGREVHLIDYLPTALMDPDYFGQGDDASDPGTDTYYHTITGFPWGMDFPVAYEYTCEYREPSIAYLHFIEWIQSGGTLFTDWYSNTGAGYRNTTYIWAP